MSYPGIFKRTGWRFIAPVSAAVLLAGAFTGLPSWAFEDPPLPAGSVEGIFEMELEGEGTKPSGIQPSPVPIIPPAPDVTPVKPPVQVPPTMPLPVSEPPPVEVAPSAPAEGTRLDNEFIRVIVNPGPLDLGRMAIETTGGNPEHRRDDNQPLLYGRPRPWTSFTTVRIDGRDWVFGGETKRRAGKGLPAGQLLKAPTLEGPERDRELVTEFQMGPLKVSQRLKLARSATTRMKDAVLVRYDLTNTSGAPVAGGLRVLVDTMLGSNDGAPFRAGGSAVTSETVIRNLDLPAFWQAFDNLKNPSVIIEGVLEGEGLNKPDAIALANWGSLADKPWDFDPVDGRGFQREGEEAMDSALALYFGPQPIAPGQTRTIQTQLGVGGITTAPGDLAIGLTAKSEIAFHPTKPQDVPVVAYVENTSGFEAKDVVVALNLTDGLMVIGENRQELGTLRPGQVVAAAFKLRANGRSFQPQKLSAVVESSNFEGNQASRDLTILDPPQVKVSVVAPPGLRLKADNTWEKNPFQVQLVIDNPTVWDLKQLAVKANLGSGLVTPRYESLERTIAGLGPKSKEIVDFLFEANGRAYGDLPFSFVVTGVDIPQARTEGTVLVPPQEPRLKMKPQEAPYRQGDYAFFDVALEGMDQLKSGEVEVSWDPSELRMVREAEGTLSFFDDIDIKGGVGDSEKGGKWTFVARGEAFTGNDTLARLHFAVKSQNPKICVKGRLVGSDNTSIKVAPSSCLGSQ